MTAPFATGGNELIAQLEEARAKLDRGSDQLAALADRRENLTDKIERLRWLLNLFLLDGFEWDELHALKAEVEQFSRDCRALGRKRRVTLPQDGRNADGLEIHHGKIHGLYAQAIGNKSDDGR